MTTCIWWVDLGGKWQPCGLNAVAKSDFPDKAPLCKEHKAGEWAAVMGKPSKAGR